MLRYVTSPIIDRCFTKLHGINKEFNKKICQVNNDKWKNVPHKSSSNNYHSVLNFGLTFQKYRHDDSYFENRLFLNSLPNFSWNVVEQAHFVVEGKRHIQDEYLRFYETIDDCVKDIKPNTILLSSVLQYLQDPGNIIDSLIKIGSDVILIDRTIVNSNSVNNIYIQHVSSTIYSASYPCYSLSESWLLNRIGNTYDMVADFTSLDFPALRNINSEFKGYIFKKMA